MRRLFGHLSGIIIFFILIIISSFSVKAIGVQPLTMDFSMSSGRVRGFPINIRLFRHCGKCFDIYHQCTRIIPAFWGYRIADPESFSRGELDRG